MLGWERMTRASPRISTLKRWVVTLALGANALISFAGAADEIVSGAEIEAKAYDIRTIRPSRSGRVYLLEKTGEEMPVSGKIFLLREGNTPVMALRVLKTYPDTFRIAAKKLKNYPGFEVLTRNSRFRAFEKVGDVVPPVPPSEEDLKDLEDLESNAIEELPPEAPPEEGPMEGLEELPAEPPQEEEMESLEEAPLEEEPLEELPEEEFASDAPSEPGQEFSEEEPGEEDLEIRDTVVEEDIDLSFPNQFTMAIGMMPDMGLIGKVKVPGPATKIGGGLLYARDFGPTFAMEAGFFYYKSSGEVNGTTITMTMVPVVANLRWQTRWREIWTGYLYAGGMYPMVASQIGASTLLLKQIQVLQPTLGAGVFLQTGPNWFLRLNLGIDHATAGVMLRY